MAHIIQEVFNAGADAFSNHYSIILPTSITQLAGIVDPLTLRINKVSIPEKKITNYDIEKRGRSFSRPNGKIDQEKDVSLTFRVDKKFLCYKAISNWMNYIQNNETAFMASDSGIDGSGGMSTFRADLEVWAIDNLDSNNYAGTPNTIWRLLGAYPTNLSGIDFDDEGGDDAITADVTLTCFNIIYPAV